MLNTLQTNDYDVMFYFGLIQRLGDVIQKVQRHHDLIKVACREIGNVYLATMKQFSLYQG